MSQIILKSKQELAYTYMARRDNIFITGPAGTGKTSVIRMFIKNYKHSRCIAVTSTTGTSALLLGGTTLHSFLGIGLGTAPVQVLVEKIEAWRWLRQRWRALECLFIDEVSMLNPELFDKLETIARIVRKDERPFGGIQLVLSGDYMQLPVVGSDNFCFQAKSWDQCIQHTVYLDEIIRQSSDVQFQKVLNAVRLGNITDEVRQVLDSRVGVELVNDFGIRPTQLYSTNDDVDRINNEELDLLAEDGRQFYEYEMETVVYSHIRNKTAALEKFKKNCNAPDNIQLCIGAQVMLLKNLDLAQGLANGSRGVVISFIGEMPVVRFLNGIERVIDWEIWEVEDGTKKILRAKQLPLRIAYALTIHKVQGGTLDYAAMDLRRVFEYGQAYVALSRVKNLKSLKLIGIDYDRIKAHPIAKEWYQKLS